MIPKSFRAPLAALLLTSFTLAAAAAPIRGQYIVQFKDHVTNPHALAQGLVQAQGGMVLHTYSTAIKGFAARLPDEAVEALRHNPDVERIEQDETVQINDVQTSPTWGLDRIDQRDAALDALYNYGYTGAGVTAFILDTGIRADHAEFTGRVLVDAGYTAIADGNGTNDCKGHGTHVAGTVGGITYGVAKQVTFVPVRVLDCTGSGAYSGIIDGVDFVAASTARPAVANMSLGGSVNAILNAAVAGAVAKGVTFVVSAGNSNTDACTASPASEPSAITVGAIAQGDARASFSNFGSCLDVFAPGNLITSAWNTSSTATNTISGTSMAAPHVTGVAALATQANPGATPATIAALITSSASPNHVTDAGTGSPNLLVYSALTSSGITPTPQTTVAVSSLSGLAVKVSSSWYAQVTIGIRNVGAGTGLAGVTVSGSFAPGSAASCVTGSAGTCAVKSATFSKSVSSTAFTITAATGTNLVYDASQNSASQIRVNRP